MIEGRFGENGQIYFEIDLITRDGLSLSTEAMLDTGFTEFLAISQQDLESLDWTFISQDKLRTAQGEATFDIYLGKVAIANREFEVPNICRRRDKRNFIRFSMVKNIHFNS